MDDRTDMLYAYTGERKWHRWKKIIRIVKPKIGRGRDECECSKGPACSEDIRHVCCVIYVVYIYQRKTFVKRVGCYTKTNERCADIRGEHVTWSPLNSILASWTTVISHTSSLLELLLYTFDHTYTTQPRNDSGNVEMYFCWLMFNEIPWYIY